MKFRALISSVQSEFADKRRMLKGYIEHNPVLRRFFSVQVELFPDKLVVMNPGTINPGIRRNAIAQIVGVCEATVKRRLRGLSSTVEFRGAPKTGGYYALPSLPISST